MRVLCGQNVTHKDGSDDLRAFSLYEPRTTKEIGTAGSATGKALKKLGLKPSIRGWDLFSIALAVIAADDCFPRSSSPDGWTREINLEVELASPDEWRPQVNHYQEMLGWLTGDIWRLSFLDGGTVPAYETRTEPPIVDSICLLSGGMDSFIGAANLVGSGSTPMLVSQIARGDTKRQRSFAAALNPAGLHLQLSHTLNHPWDSERSQRARSVLFLATAALAATALPVGRLKLYVPENGFISLNPPLTPLRIGSLSTRTTHPRFLAKFQSILDASQIALEITNPYEHKTKGEMLRDCNNREKLLPLLFETTSCGRFARNTFKHCGRCVPCIIRRAAFRACDIHDLTVYRYANLGTNDEKHVGYDDVRSVAIAVNTVKETGVRRWAANALSTVDLDPIEPYEGMLERGIVELENFLKSVECLD